MSRLLPIREAAQALGVSESTLRRGAPIAQRGRRGKGGAALYDVDVLRAWRAGDRDAAQASEFLELLAAVLWAQFVTASGPHKRGLAGDFAAAWFRMCFELEDRGINVSSAPSEVERLRLIGHGMSE